DAAREQRGVERAGLDERLEDALVHAARIHALREVEEVLERPGAARVEDGLQRRLAHPADRAEAEADLGTESILDAAAAARGLPAVRRAVALRGLLRGVVHDREVDLRFVHLGRE